MKPVQKYLRDLFAKKRILANDPKLTGLAEAEALLLGLVNEKKVPGLSITVLKEGKTILQKGYGYADLENNIPVDPKRTIFRIASVSKPIAATALAHMVADGQIDLDASFYDYVPYYPKKKWDFSIRQLASHTAGIRSYRGTEYGLNEPYSIKEGIAIFKDDELIFEPGKGYGYNSFDWVLVSLAMQEASGMPFEEYVRLKVLEPLGMKNTFAPNQNIPSEPQSGSKGRESKNESADEVTDASEPSLDQGPRPKSYPGPVSRSNQERVSRSDESASVTKFYSKNRKGFRPAIPVNNHYKLAGGGYLSTSEDIAKFGQSYLNTMDPTNKIPSIPEAEIRTEFLTSQIINGKPTHYGLGWQVSEDVNGRQFYGHVGNGVGGYSNFFVYPNQQMVFSILINCTDPKIQDELDAVVALL